MQFKKNKFSLSKGQKILVYLLLIASIIARFLPKPALAQKIGNLGLCECNPAPAGNGIQTGLGCIPADPKCLVIWLLFWAIRIGGGIAFLLMLWGGAQIMLSSGNPQKIEEGKQIITAAIAGLLVIILSVFLLRLIGAEILTLPGFTP